MTVAEIRQKYLDFFRARGHVVVPSARLVPENDPTTLFTGSGMQPMLPYLLGQPYPLGNRIADSQKSFRAQDIEEVGDNRHTTFFEMLGNWSFGDYYKDEHIPWMYEFLTKELGLPKEKLYFTCYEGNSALGLPKDTRSAELWKSLGVPDDHVSFYGDTKNWWSRVGIPEKMPEGEPGGPDSEIFYDFGTPHDSAFGEACHPNCDCGRFMEIGNNVFMEYVKREGKFEKLPKPNVDFGGGLERLAAAVRDNNDVFTIDVFQPIIVELAAASGKHYGDPEYQKSFRVVADHIRATTFMLGDSVAPSKTDRGYVLRRLIRRAVRHLDKLGVGEGMLVKIAEKIINVYSGQYPELSAARLQIHDALRDEETQFRKTLSAGLKEFEKLSGTSVSGQEAFQLFSTYGFPVEMTEELAKERDMEVDVEGFREEMKKHQSDSRAGSTQKFAGGLADHAEQTVKYHTTHHILLAALRKVLGRDVHQRGSNITSERLRIDFAHDTKMTDEEKKHVEEMVNDIIYQDLPMTRTLMKREEAEKLGAEMEFGVKYPDMVSVYSLGPKDASEADPKIPEAFSLEFCGGPHVDNTREIHEGGKRFRIAKEEAVSAGVRRIKGVVE